jgi:hypothetical protein
MFRVLICKEAVIKFGGNLVSLHGMAASWANAK